MYTDHEEHVTLHLCTCDKEAHQASAPQKAQFVLSSFTTMLPFLKYTTACSVLQRNSIANQRHQRYCRRLSPLMNSISFSISCARDLTGSSTSSSNSPRKGMVSGNNTKYSSLRLSTRYFTILSPKMRDRTFSLRVCINTCNIENRM